MPHSAVQIPGEFTDVTAEWLAAVLAEAGFGDVEISGVAVTPLALGEGFVGRLARVEPVYSSSHPALPLSLVIKLAATDPAGVALSVLLRFWELEAGFYSEVAPKLPVRTPQCFYSRAAPEAGRFALLMEDLSWLTAGDQVLGLARPQVELAVDWLARFHARFWGDETLEEWPWIPRVASDPMYQALQPMLASVWSAFVDRYGNDSPPEVLRWIEQLIPDLTDTLLADSLPETLTHADFRADNLFFDDHGELAVIDWQSITVFQGLYDLAYLLGSSLAVDLRRDLERSLVERYRRGLVDAGVTGLPSTAQLFDVYRKSVLTASAIVALLLGQLDLEVNPRGAELGHQIVRRMFQAAADLKVCDFLRA